MHPRGKKNSQCEPRRWTSSLVRSHTLVQTQISGGTSGVDGEAHIAKAHQERDSHAMGTEHESKFSEMAADSVKTTAMRAMLPKDVLERFLDGPFQYEELRIVCLQMWERSWLDKMRTVELNPWTLVRSTSPKERTKMTMQFNSAVRMINPISRTANLSPSAPRQSTPRDKKPESGETKPGTEKKKRLIWYRCGGKASSCQALAISKE